MDFFAEEINLAMDHPGYDDSVASVQQEVYSTAQLFFELEEALCKFSCTQYADVNKMFPLTYTPPCHLKVGLI